MTKIYNRFKIKGLGLLMVAVLSPGFLKMRYYGAALTSMVLPFGNTSTMSVELNCEVGAHGSYTY